MEFTHLKISYFRNLLAVELAPVADGVNFIYGNNGSGKTSLLEAIYYLSVARSFRSPLVARIIHHDAPGLAIFAQFTSDDKQTMSAGLERYINSDLKIRLQGKDVNSIVELANVLPLQLMDSYCHHLIDGAPTFRRKYLDWLGFYLSHHFLSCWKQFVRALKQRNAALRGQTLAAELAIWDRELVEGALRLHKLRQEYAELIVPVIEKLIAELLLISGLKITYETGWRATEEYADVLAQNRDRDMQLGHTQFGPHKADLKITINNIPAKDILSRGQQKLFVCAMILARGALLQSYANKRPVYLVDDLPSELDVKNGSRLITLLSRQEAQIFMTAAENKSWVNALTTKPIKMFHVEHGKVSEKD